MRLRTASLIVTLFMSSVIGVRGQAEQATPVETQQALVARLTAQQKQQFDAAGKAFSTAHFADALTAYKLLLKDLPGDAASQSLQVKPLWMSATQLLHLKR